MEKIELCLDDKKGELFFGDNCNIMLSRSQIAWLQRELEKVIGPAYSSILYESAHIYAHHMISDIMDGVMKASGKLHKEQLAEEMVKQLAVWGYGRGEIVEIDLSVPYSKVKVVNSFNALDYEKTQKPVCHFLRGIIAGSSCIITGIEMYCLETKCVAVGDPFCEFEVIALDEAKRRRLSD